MIDQNDQKTLDLLPVTEEKKGKGRPRKHADAAAKQKAYREKLKADGKRVISRVTLDMRDETKPLHSEVLDLSVIPAYRKKSGNGS